MRRIAVLSGTNAPFVDKRVAENLVEFIGRWRPDRLIHLGSLIDRSLLASWAEKTGMEIPTLVTEGVESARSFLDALRSVHGGQFSLVESMGASPSSTSELIDLAEYELDLVEGALDFAPGWTALYGDSGFTVSPVAGSTARLASMKIGKSVVMGYTHRLGLVGQTTGYQGWTDIKWGLEVGHLMDLRKADYVMRKGGHADWQRGFGIFYIEGDKVFPKPVMVGNDGSFEVDGYVFPGGRKVA